MNAQVALENQIEEAEKLIVQLQAKAALEARNERARQRADEFNAFASLLNFATGNNVRAPRPRRRKILL